MVDKVKVGIIGCGNISDRYIETIRSFRILDLVACADLDIERARAKASSFDIPHGYSVPELLADSQIEIVVNLTIPQAHAEVSLAALRAGKHVHTEKPLGIDIDEGRQILELAEEKGLRVGCAPDTFLGGGLQTARKLIDDGWIGQPVGAMAFLLSSGPDNWHPNPTFFYQQGAGPMMDMGPYYLTALVHLLGPVNQVTGMTRISYPERVIGSGPKFGEVMPVEVPTYVTGLLNFASGPIGTIITSFDGWHSTLPHIEIYGSQGTLQLADPNFFSGPVRLRRAADETWHDIPLSHSDQVTRGMGVADLGHAIRDGRPHRASGALGYHVLDIMLSFEMSMQTGQHISLISQCDQPAPLPTGLLNGMLDG
ncbi:Gfo/Idh/MocA family oxidoreductase [Anaerolineales bacterium HSG6]|nr:Gfo/Idh/MocA family oxidoreductase [Anaerolineales bacterium HSG6]